jgi:hypothetical protein
MLKYELDSIDGLDDDVQKMYTEKDGKFTLTVSGLPATPNAEEVNGLKKKVDDLLAEKKEEGRKRKAAEKKAATETAAAAQKSGDVDAINASWQTKYDTDLAAANDERDGALKMLRMEKVHSKAVELASTLAVPGSADVLLPHIESRLSMDIKDGRAVAVVMDTKGQPSALTVEELGKEIANNVAFAPLIEASRAAGGGANGTQSGGAATKTATRESYESWNPNQKRKFFADGGTLTE